MVTAISYSMENETTSEMSKFYQRSHHPTIFHQSREKKMDPLKRIEKAFHPILMASFNYKDFQFNDKIKLSLNRKPHICVT